MAVYRGAHDTPEIIERDDHLIDASNAARYFDDYRDWPACEKKSLGLAKGRVLDVGCGAGRHGLYLQRKGFDVTGIDRSPGAIRVSRLRGYKNVRLMSIAEINRFRPNSFDTVIMMGNNFGLLGGWKRAKRLLSTFHRVTSPDGQIIAQTVDPYTTADPVHIGYHRFNRRRGRMGGQLRIRVRYKKIVGEWFDYLLASQKEMNQILGGTGWQVSQILNCDGPGYIAVIKKTAPESLPRSPQNRSLQRQRRRRYSERMTPDEDQDQSLTEQEALLAASLPAELVTRIDHALLAKATHRSKKVARIVGEVMQSFSDRPLGIPDLYYAQRIAKLVKAGLLEARGNPLRMRFSEVRLPGPDLSMLPRSVQDRF